LQRLWGKLSWASFIKKHIFKVKRGGVSLRRTRKFIGVASRYGRPQALPIRRLLQHEEFVAVAFGVPPEHFDLGGLAMGVHLFCLGDTGIPHRTLIVRDPRLYRTRT
jgi:hypothetical protein